MGDTAFGHLPHGHLPVSPTIPGRRGLSMLIRRITELLIVVVVMAVSSLMKVTTGILMIVDLSEPGRAPWNPRQRN